MMPPPDADQEDLSATAVLEELTSGRNLLDGVIPDLPDPLPNGTRFALGSCQYQAGFLDGPTAYRSYRELGERLLSEEARPRFVVLTGDQVYVDATAGLFDPSQSDGRFDLPYHRWLRSRSTRNVLRQIHSYMLLDDHEIEDNWEFPDDTDDRDKGIESYMKYQRDKKDLPAQRFFPFLFDGFRFFMLDSRTQRQGRKLDNIRTASLIDQAELDDTPDKQPQMKALKDWLDDTEESMPNFIVSPSMLVPRHRRAARWGDPASALHSDGWDGYPGCLEKLLSLVAENNAQNIVFLSGDEHLGCIATITIRKLDGGGEVVSEKTCYSIHTSGTYTPYPFANSIPEDWLPETGTAFTVNNIDYDYTVSYTAYPGEGFTYINVEKQDGKWHMTCEYSGGAALQIF